MNHRTDTAPDSANGMCPPRALLLTASAAARAMSRTLRRLSRRAAMSARHSGRGWTRWAPLSLRWAPVRKAGRGVGAARTTAWPARSLSHCHWHIQVALPARTIPGRHGPRALAGTAPDLAHTRIEPASPPRAGRAGRTGSAGPHGLAGRPGKAAASVPAGSQWTSVAAPFPWRHFDDSSDSHSFARLTASVRSERPPAHSRRAAPPRRGPLSGSARRHMPAPPAFGNARLHGAFAPPARRRTVAGAAAERMAAAAAAVHLTAPASTVAGRRPAIARRAIIMCVVSARQRVDAQERGAMPGAESISLRAVVPGRERAAVTPAGPAQRPGLLPESADIARRARAGRGLATAMPGPAPRPMVQRPVDLMWSAGVTGSGPAADPLRHAPPVLAVPAVMEPARPVQSRIADTTGAHAALDPVLADRLAEEIMRRIDRRARIERERRGI